METVGTEARPIESAEPMKVARALLYDVFKTPSKLSGLWFHKGVYYTWAGGRWQKVDDNQVQGTCARELEDAYVLRGGEVTRYAPTTSRLKEVMFALANLCELPHDQLPLWVVGGVPEGWEETDVLVTFEDVIFHPGRMETMKRTEAWFDPFVVPCEFDATAECPVWLRCLEEWSDGDEKWTQLLQMWFGYCLMSTRKYAKWLLMHGKSRAGKGTILKVLSMLCPGGVAGTTLPFFSSKFGLQGLVGRKVMSIAEVSALEIERAGEAAHNLKLILGQDPVTVNPKYGKPLHDVVLPVAPMIQCNSIPHLPNDAEGLSVKMLPLPFTVSFAGREDPDLVEKLEGELPGIAAWALEGARRLLAEGVFTQALRSAELMERYLAENNPLEMFLEARFLRKKEGFVRFDMIRRQYNSWCKVHRIVKAEQVGLLHLPSRLESGTSWDLRRGRLGPSEPRGFYGLSLRKEPDDEAGL